MSFLGVIHRLDKPVGGIVIFAKTSKALSRLNEAMREGKIHKTYTATVDGHMPSDAGTLENFLLHDDYKAEVVKGGTPGAKLARLQYKVLKKEASSSVVELQLETGRYHQIRAQCAAAGAPILGDAKYGSSRPSKDGFLALRHTRVMFPHPITQEPIVIQSPSL